jgi:hypothetical protein
MNVMAEIYKNATPIYEDATPSPADLIRSISEQGYSFQASLADLIDNSISAKAAQIEVLVSCEQEPFMLFIADDGIGMTESELISAMKLPSQSPLKGRASKDLGRFGLGMKTASFSQTRKFTVVSRKKGQKTYSARTWDLKVLEKGEWKITVNSQVEIAAIVSEYKKICGLFLNRFIDYEPNTIVVWHGLHKFEDFISEKNSKEILSKELKEVVAEHLSISFHRFLESTNNPIAIRLNNTILDPFNPFPVDIKDVRPIEPLSRRFNNDNFSIEGFVLPSRAISESHGHSVWTTKYLSLLDMEGIYVYRADRLISFGGWSNLAKKTSRHNLARLKVDIGNNSDLHLHLNVAKSQVKIPDDLRVGLQKYIANLKVEALREYNNKSVKAANKQTVKNQDFLNIIRTSKGSSFEINKDFPLFKSATAGLNEIQASSLKALLRLLTVKLNIIKDSHEPEPFHMAIGNQQHMTEKELLNSVSELVSSGIPKNVILKLIVPDYGFEPSSLPHSVLKFLE